MHRPEYAQVPDGRDVSDVDPYWQGLQTGSTLPLSYLPAAATGQQTGWRRGAVWVLIVLMVSAASGGVCLTYGPGELFRLLAQ